MNLDLVSEVLREGVFLVIRISAPMLLLSMLVGVLLAIFQAVTQIHEQTLSFIFKLTVVLSVLLIGGSWIMESLLSYAQWLYELMRA